MLGQLYLALAILASAHGVCAAPRACVRPTGVPSPSPSPSPAPSPSPSPAPPTPSGLSLSSTFIYELDRRNIDVPVVTSDTGVEIDAQVYIVDLENHTPAEIQRYRDAGKTVACYFSAGTWEPWRADRLDFLPECYCGPGVEVDAEGLCVGPGSEDNYLGSWDEWWLDIHSPACRENVRAVQLARIQAGQARNCDGLDPDNVDSHINSQQHGNTQQDSFDHLMWMADEIHNLGMLAGLKNSPGLIRDDVYGPPITANFDFGVIESCDVWSECHNYDRFLDAGKPQIQIEYNNRITECPADIPAGRSLAVYSGRTLDTRTITLNCPTL